MRLVKATTLLFVVAACEIGDSRPPEQLAGPDCSAILRSPGPPRLVSVSPDGSVAANETLACATCIGGASGGWAFRDPEGIVVEVGGARERVTPAPGSRVGPLSLAGVIAGQGFAVVDLGTHLHVLDPEGVLPPRLDLPTLNAEERLLAIARRPGGGAFSIAVPGKLSTTRSVLFGAFDPLDLRGPGRRSLARFDGSPATAVVFASGERVSLPSPTLVPAAAARDDKVLLIRPQGSWLIWRSGEVETIPQSTAVAMSGSGDVWTLQGQRRTIEARDRPGVSRPLFSPREGVDLAGAPLPPGARILKILFASQDDKALIIERIEGNACGYEDRVHIVDLTTAAVKTVASGEGMRMTPAYLGDRFRFVEASVSLDAP